MEDEYQEYLREECEALRRAERRWEQALRKRKRQRRLLYAAFLCLAIAVAAAIAWLL